MWNDCNDNEPLISPVGVETPNETDDDCDGTVDEGTLNFDDDGDGYCENPPCMGSTIALATDAGIKIDCNDNEPLISPVGVEIPNEIDDDCDEIVDEDTEVYDDDGDGYCESPPCIGSVFSLNADSSNKIDCDDAVLTIYLGAPETPNGVDDDCDDTVDEGTIDFDDDGDGYCESSNCIGSISALEADFNLYQDCLDSNDLVFPNQPEYFDEPYDNQGTDSFDYNCDNDVQLQYPDVISCDQDFGSSTLCGLEEDNAGWFDTVPGCGEHANFADEDGICVNNLPTDTKCYPYENPNYLFMQFQGCHWNTLRLRFLVDWILCQNTSVYVHKYLLYDILDSNEDVMKEYISEVVTKV